MYNRLFKYKYCVFQYTRLCDSTVYIQYFPEKKSPPLPEKKIKINKITRILEQLLQSIYDDVIVDSAL